MTKFKVEVAEKAEELLETEENKKDSKYENLLDTELDEPAKPNSEHQAARASNDNAASLLTNMKTLTFPFISMLVLGINCVIERKPLKVKACLSEQIQWFKNLFFTDE